MPTTGLHRVAYRGQSEKKVKATLNFLRLRPIKDTTTMKRSKISEAALKAETGN